MPCDVRLRGEDLTTYLREKGWSELQIGDLQRDIRAAHGDPVAEQEARRVAHDRVHVKLDPLMAEIDALARRVKTR